MAGVSRCRYRIRTAVLCYMAAARPEACAASCREGVFANMENIAGPQAAKSPRLCRVMMAFLPESIPATYFANFMTYGIGVAGLGGSLPAHSSSGLPAHPALDATRFPDQMHSHFHFLPQLLKCWSK